MSLPALTHHEIVRLVEPFARQGRLVDLAASDRSARRIAFRSLDLPAEAPDAACAPGGPSGGLSSDRAGGLFSSLSGSPSCSPSGKQFSGTPACRESLALECRADNYFILLRTLTPATGPAATVCATGSEPGDLLARVSAVPVAQLFGAGPGWRVARSYDTQLPSGVRRPRAAAGTSLPPLVMTRAELQAGGLTLTLAIKLPGLRTVPADLTLSLPLGPGPVPALPEDLLAVLGWDWARLVRDKQGWTSKLRLRGAVLRRSRTAEAALDQAGAHLAHVLAGSPGRYHDEHQLARWGVVLRRGLPTLTAVFMVLGALLLPRVLDPANTGMWLALHYVPIGLLALAFTLQELPQFEIPPWPRRSAAPGWNDSDAAPDAAVQTLV